MLREKNNYDVKRVGEGCYSSSCSFANIQNFIGVTIIEYLNHANELLSCSSVSSLPQALVNMVGKDLLQITFLKLSEESGQTEWYELA